MYEATAISKELEDFISAVCEWHDIEIRTDYSGRGMYGAKCLGLVFDGTPGQLFSAFINALTLDDDYLKLELSDVFAEMASDSMGWNSIYYFPGWNFIDEDSETEDEDEE